MTAETQPYLTESAPYFNDFFCPPSTDFGLFLAECDRLAEFDPEILKKIKGDLDAYALEKKALRQAEKLHVQRQTAPLPCFDEEEGFPVPAQLSEGRPRMPEEMVLMLLLARGYLGSTTSSRCLDRLKDSLALDSWLGARYWSLPARTTIYENLNAVSMETKDRIHKKQMEMAGKEGLDDFLLELVDSTAVEANSAWPTDSAIVYGLLWKACRIGWNLDKLGLTNMPEGKLPVWLAELGKLPFQINLAAKKQKELRKKYLEFCTIAAKMAGRLTNDYRKKSTQWKETLESENLSPLLRRRGQKAVDELERCIYDGAKTLQQTYDRVFEDKKSKARDRILSLNDETAAFIQKGGREPVIGYKPQLCRSGNGYVTFMSVPEGNAADSAQFVEAAKGCIELTKVVPETFSADDGYSSRQGVNEVRELGVKVVSISGAKGKNLLGDLWEEDAYADARRYRSSVESLMFCLKHSYHFGSVGRIGIDAVRHELKEKCLAYNQCRAILLRQRKRIREEQERMPRVS